MCWFCVFLCRSHNTTPNIKVIFSERWPKHTKRIYDRVSHYPCWALVSMASWAADERRFHLQASSGLCLMLIPPGWRDESAAALQRPNSDLIPKGWHNSVPWWDEDTLAQGRRILGLCGNIKKKQGREFLIRRNVPIFINFYISTAFLFYHTKIKHKD